MWIFFQAHCESCKRQFQSLSCLPITAPVVAVGYWGTKETLQKELRRYGHRGAAVMGDKNLAERNDFKQTPTLLIINKNGLIKNKYTAVVDCSVLKKELSQ
ncbi:MAG: hypothetical protein K2Q26_00315 [Bdellovibrionales bacterium]|nr:hypothetical protein [Bdellovibrionales bacterium]